MRVAAVCFAAAAAATCSESGPGSGSGGAGTAGGGAGTTGSGGSAGGGGGPGGSTGTAGSGGVTGAAGGGGATGSGGLAGTGDAGGAAGGGGVTGAAGNAGTSGGAAGNAGTSGGGTTGTAGSGDGGAGRGGSSGSAGTAGGGGVTGGGGGAGVGAGGRDGSADGGGPGGSGGTPAACPAATPPTGGTRYCSNVKGTAAGGYSYELWAAAGGSGCMTVYRSDAKFSAEWTDVQDFLARMGLQFDRTRTPAEVGTITAEFAETKTGSGGLTYVGVYGWTLNPLREYYILDDWGDVKPGGTASDGTARTAVGTIMVDGETYDVWKKTRENKPNITGRDQTFDQYFSIRRTARQCGRISVSEHFSKWVELGLPLGDLVETTILLEAQRNSGTISFTTATVTVR